MPPDSFSRYSREDLLCQGGDVCARPDRRGEIGDIVVSNYGDDRGIRYRERLLVKCFSPNFDFGFLRLDITFDNYQFALGEHRSEAGVALVSHRLRSFFRRPKNRIHLLRENPNNRRARFSMPVRIFARSI